jgi:hypothetical protein
MLSEAVAPFILLCEDDIALARCAAAALQHAIDTLPHDRWGYASLYTPWHNLGFQQPRPGWQPLNIGRSSWGALAYCFSRASLEALLACEILREHTTDRETDTVVSAAMASLGRDGFFHVPSLCEHTGMGISSVGHVHVREMTAVEFAADYNGYATC